VSFDDGQHYYTKRESTLYEKKRVALYKYMANRVLWRAQADSGARRVDQKGRGYVLEGTMHAVDSLVTSGERGMG